MKKNLTRSQRSSVRSREHGGAGVKFLIAFVLLFLAGHAGYQFIPAAYKAEEFRKRMHEVVVNAYALPNAPTNTPEAVKQRLRSYANDEGVPPDAYIKVEKGENGSLRAHVYFIKPIDLLPFGMYTYKYEFNHIATPSGFMNK